ncbi:5-oxoprolinase subunit C family protein [Gryllotalpicola ginsengisoli]|uniref:5-oxoprolinase subunit C family protein n=1 Tax=Gryllotalpicola ginsengisoli TaxID=444608 RepID=UPI0003B57673|nr:biotin-dependent carboxyltransferase family protein [Gryllotalpicola ginsengisoli]
MAVLAVEGVGWQALVEDAGRPGFADVGLGSAGYADTASADLANRLVGNRHGSALVEALFGGLAVRARGAALVAATGAPCPVLVRGEDGRMRGAAMYEVIDLRDGDRLELGSPSVGLRSYLAVRGGIDVEPVLGSRSRDTLAGVGPAPLAPGDLLPIGGNDAEWPSVDAVPWPGWTSGGEVVLDAVRGPRDDWFEPAAMAWLGAGTFTVSSQADRIGVRLTSAQPLTRRERGELPSEGAELGSVQVPPDGHPILFLADHPVTGGYPVAAVLTRASIARAAQLVPGQQVRLRLLPAPPLP